MREWRRAIGAALRLALAADRRRAVISLVAWPVGGLLLPLQALWLKLVIDGAEAGARTQVLVGSGLVAATATAGLSCFMVFITTGTRVIEETDREIDRRLIGLTGGIAGIDHLERAEYLDRIELLRTGRRELAAMVGAVGEGLMSVTRVGGTAVLLVGVHPALLLLPAFALPSVVLARHGQRLIEDAEDDTAGDQRLALHLFDLATRPSPGKELRVFGLEATIAERHRSRQRAVDARLASARTGAALRSSAGFAVFAAGYVAAIALVAREASAGRATAGDLLLTLAAAAQVRNQAGSVAYTVRALAAGTKAMGRYLWLVDHAAATGQHRHGGIPGPVPDRLTDGIHLHGVALRYPGAARPAIDGVDLHLPAGAVVAVVGENGAGKSTLVKLLAALYQPTSGTITVDGTPFDHFDTLDWRARISAGFEDFVAFELLVRETVGVGDLTAIDDEDAVRSALDRAGAAGLPQQLPSGLTTPLGSTMDGGVDLSKGQWQKLALARAMMRTRPLLLLLDEPTAALDAETEHALFERYAGAARRVGEDTGAITVLVSHRFSTVRMADLIVVVDQGRIVETGSHAELLDRHGVYADLYELQAQGYR